MPSTPLPYLNISCTCAECTSFLRPYTTPPTTLFHLPPGLAFDPSPAITPSLDPATPSLAPSPIFTLTRPSLSKPRTKTPSISLSPPRFSEKEVPERVALASRALWMQTSSPVTSPLTSAKTPGLERCIGEGCEKRVVPGFGKVLCGECTGGLRGSIARMLEEEKKEGKEEEMSWDRVDSLVSSPPPSLSPQPEREVESKSKDAQDQDSEFPLVALPSTTLAAVHAAHALTLSQQPTPEPSPHLLLFALPALSTPVEEKPATPTDDYSHSARYFIEFPPLPLPTSGSNGSVVGRKRNSNGDSSKTCTSNSSTWGLGADTSALFATSAKPSARLCSTNASVAGSKRDRTGEFDTSPLEWQAV